MSNKVESKESKSLRDKMRTLTVGKTHDFQDRIVDWEGTKFELREPSLLTKNNVEKACTTVDSAGYISVDRLAMAVRHVIEGCYVPGTDERVYDDSDYDDLVAAPDYGFLQTLADAVADMMVVDLSAKKRI